MATVQKFLWELRFIAGNTQKNIAKTIIDMAQILEFNDFSSSKAPLISIIIHFK